MITRVFPQKADIELSQSHFIETSVVTGIICKTYLELYKGQSISLTNSY